MKSLYSLLILFFLFYTLNAQIINIPDANFKAALIDLGVDTNDDGEIQISEAETQNSGLNVSGYFISSLSGIEYFINIHYLDCSDNQITELNLSSLANMTDLYCNDNLLTELTLNLTALTWLQCYNNQLSILNISNVPNLQYLNCGNNLLTSLDFTSFTDQDSFWLIDLSNNNLTTLDVSNLQSIDDLIVDNNELTSINLCPITWEILSVGNNYLTEIDISNSPNLEGIFCANNLLTSLDISNNNMLINLYASNNEFTSLNLGNAESLAWDGDVFFDGNPNLSVVCTTENNFEWVQDKLTEYNYTDCTISSYCSFDPNGEYFVVQGQTLLDLDNNGCDVSDVFSSHQKFNISSNDFFDTFYADSEGEFELYISAGLHTVTPSFENPDYFTVSPSGISVDFPSDSSPFVQDFCITPNGTFNDLEITIIPLEAARPGFDTNYKIVYKNKGTTTLSGDINFGFQDEVMEFMSSIPANESGLPDLLSYSFTDLLPFESREITLTMNLNAPTDVNPLNGGDVLTFITSIDAAADETPDDNTFELHQTVVNSFDPNDKTCLEGYTITPEMVGDYVHYMIRFENTGTADAINIVVKDHIDRTKYDLSSLVATDASHDFVARIKDDASDYYVEFIFENINLPFDDANNDGYVVFKIRTLDTLVLNDTFENEAEIYFDFNFPIITNLEQTTVATLSTEDFELANNAIKLYPNPTSEILQLESKQALKQITVYDISGRNIQDIAVIGNTTEITISTQDFSAGTYFVNIKTESSELVKTFIKD
ncbi:MAG: T9SS type A sorting domain-containing protein [Psychroserpens sp.]|nr:T9SS type A sorting domain-containing protein [Psychroserpens sp.]